MSAQSALARRTARATRSPSIRGRALRADVAAVVQEAAVLLGRDLAPPNLLDDALRLLDELTEQVLEGGASTDELRIVKRLRDVTVDLRLDAAHRRQETMLAGVQRALEQLEEIGSLRALIGRTPAVVSDAFGFDRVLVSQVADTRWTPLGVHLRDDPAAGGALIAAAGPRVLNHQVREAEIVRRRIPLLVPMQRPSSPGRASITEGILARRSYVAAPIMPQGTVIGLLHADNATSRGELGSLDRDVLALFAEGFGLLLRNVVLQNRVQILKGQVQALGAQIRAFEAEEIRLDLAADPGPAAQDHPIAVRRDRRTTSLTPREQDVMELLAKGARNGEIAARMVISEGTVKSHVKHILRKLQATNRAEAVSKYMRLVGVDDEPAGQG